MAKLTIYTWNLGKDGVPGKVVVETARRVDLVLGIRLGRVPVKEETC